MVVPHRITIFTEPLHNCLSLWLLISVLYFLHSSPARSSVLLVPLCISMFQCFYISVFLYFCISVFLYCSPARSSILLVPLCPGPPPLCPLPLPPILIFPPWLTPRQDFPAILKWKSTRAGPLRICGNLRQYHLPPKARPQRQDLCGRQLYLRRCRNRHDVTIRSSGSSQD